MSGIRPPEFVKSSGDAARLGVEVDRNFQRAKDYLRNQMVVAPWLDGRLITGEVLAAGATTQVEHKLGRKYNGWWLCSGSVNGDYPGEGTSDDDERFLALTVTSAQTVSIWVF